MNSFLYQGFSVPTTRRSIASKRSIQEFNNKDKLALKYITYFLETISFTTGKRIEKYPITYSPIFVVVKYLNQSIDIIPITSTTYRCCLINALAANKPFVRAGSSIFALSKKETNFGIMNININKNIQSVIEIIIAGYIITDLISFFLESSSLRDWYIFWNISHSFHVASHIFTSDTSSFDITG